MELEFTQTTHVGMRRETNQDAMGCFSGEAGRLFVVCDGMGGHAGGQIASKTTVARVGEVFEGGALEEAPDELLKRSVREANRAVFSESQRKPSLTGMGTTCVGLHVRPGDEEAWWVNVGDSRIYRFRDGCLTQLSRDHTVVQRLVDEGKVSQEQASLHPQAGVLSRSVGVTGEIEVDTSKESFTLLDGDVFLICSDGLTTMMDDEDIERCMQEYSTLSVGEELLSLANARGGYDNTTIQIVAMGNRWRKHGPTESGLTRLADLILEVPEEKKPRWLWVALGAIMLLIVMAFLVCGGM